MSHYFPKDDLLRDLLGPLLDDIDDLLAHAADRRLSTHALVEAYVEVLVAHPGVVVLLARDLSSFNHPSLRDRVRDQNGRFMGLLARPGAST